MGVACLNWFGWDLRKASSIDDFPASSYLENDIFEINQIIQQSTEKHHQAMTSSEKLCLQWNDFQENLNSAFRELRSDTDLSDVTLVSEDGGQVEAHKVVLASSSPFFANLLKRNKHPHPLIFMRGVKEEVLLAIADFLYNGEANVSEENLESFLAIAEDLGLRGLTGLNTKQESPGKKLPQKFYFPREEEQEAFQPNEHSRRKSVIRQQRLENDIAPEISATNATNQLVSVDLQQLDNQIKSMMEQSGNSIMIGQRKVKTLICKMCGKEGQKADMTRHIEANHITGLSHTCDICSKTCKSRDALRQHKYKEHHA